MRSILRKLALAAASILFALALLEAALQLASLFVGEERGAGGWKSSDRLRVLCIGDSNTYGLDVESDESYPARLQQIWDTEGFRPRIEVLNIGFPGTNSSQVLRDLPRNLDLFQPDLLLLKIGVNDFWTLPVETRAVAAPSWLTRLKRWSRLYKLYHMATIHPGQRFAVVTDNRTLEHGKGKLEAFGETFDLEFRQSEGNATAHRALADNLRAIVAMTKRRGVRLVLLTYASGSVFYGISNDKLRHISRTQGTDIVDVRMAFRDPAVCPSEPCTRWIFPEGHPASFHPTVAGYEFEAKTVAARLREILDAGTAPGEPPR